MRLKNSLTRLAVLVLCTFIMQGVFWVLPSLVVQATGQQTCNNCADPACASPACPPPNIILIVADDMGWGDLCANSKSGPGCNSSTYSYYCYKDPNITGNCADDSDCTSSNYSTKTGCYRSNANTPRLDILAEKGVRLTNFYTPTPVCSPARASLMTGRHPFRHGDIDNQTIASIKGTEKTLAEALKENINPAYYTGVIGKWHLGWPDYKNQSPPDETVLPKNQGFDYSYVIPHGVYDTIDGFCLLEDWKTPPDGVSPANSFYTFTGNGTDKRQEKDCPNTRFNFIKQGQNFFDSIPYKSLTQVMTDTAIQYINNPSFKYRPNNKAPFFLYLAYPAPHTPIDLHLPDYTTNVSQSEKEKYKIVIKEISNGVGQIINEINKDATIRDNTIVIFTSDNGPWLGFHLNDPDKDHASTGGLKGGKQFTFEGGIRIPFIARWPKGYKSGLVSNQPADLMDIFTTLLTAAYASNGKTPSLSTSIDGKDITPALSGYKKIDKTIHSYSPYASAYPCGTSTCYSYQYAIQDFCAIPNGICNPDWNYYKLFLTTRGDNAICSPQDIATTCSPFDDFMYPFKAYREKELYKLDNESDDQTNSPANSDNTLKTSLGETAEAFRKEAINDHNNPSNYIYSYYLPFIKDNSTWENWFSVRAKDAVPIDVKIRVFDMGGALKGTYLYSDSDSDRGKVRWEPALKPNVSATQRPSWIVGTPTNPVWVEGSVIVETSVPAIVSTNTIANAYQGFSINEAAKPRSRHNFPKIYDGPDGYQVYLLIQNIYNTPRNVKVKLKGRYINDVGDGDYIDYIDTIAIPAFGTLKVRPWDDIVKTNKPSASPDRKFQGSVEVSSDSVPGSGDGQGPPIPAMCRYELGMYALAIYESTVVQPSLYFPVLKDGKYDTYDINGKIVKMDYQNFLSVVNPGAADATITIILYNNKGVEEGRLANEVIPANGKKTWRPSWIKGTITAPVDFEGSAVVITNLPVVGMTNTIYPGTNAYGVEAFDLLESAMPNSPLFFPKAYDNLLGGGTGATHLFDNYVYVQNPDGDEKYIKIDQFNTDGTLYGTKTVVLGPHATHVYRPKDLVVTDNNGAFRGSITIQSVDRDGKPVALPITGAMKYEIHSTTSATSPIEAITIYRSMGQ